MTRTPAHLPSPPVSRWVLLPGTGSDARFVREAFATVEFRPSEPGGPEVGSAGPGVELIAIDPDPAALVESYLSALTAMAAVPGPLVVGGVSLGAAVAARWVIDNPGRVDGLVVALPAWSGPPARASASLNARFTAACLRSDGLERTIATMTETSPTWLARTLERSWRAQWPELQAALEQAAAYVAPTCAELAAIDVSTVVVVAENDPLHPAAVGRSWADAIAGATLLTFELADLGDDSAVMGDLVRRSGVLHPC